LATQAVIASEAKQSRSCSGDCFIAGAPRNDTKHPRLEMLIQCSYGYHYSRLSEEFDIADNMKLGPIFMAKKDMCGGISSNLIKSSQKVRATAELTVNEEPLLEYQ
jgi:hypothetical protein